MLTQGNTLCIGAFRGASSQFRRPRLLFKSSYSVTIFYIPSQRRSATGARYLSLSDQRPMNVDQRPAPVGQRSAFSVQRPTLPWPPSPCVDRNRGTPGIPPSKSTPRIRVPIRVHCISIMLIMVGLNLLYIYLRFSRRKARKRAKMVENTRFSPFVDRFSPIAVDSERQTGIL